MGIYDNLILSEEVEVEEFPLDVSRNIDGDYRWWQTKELNPSMDMYGILPFSDITSGKLDRSSGDKLYLCRRHPPVTKWSDVNEGLMLEEDEDIVEDAEHWRTVRYTGTLELSEGARDGRVYVLSVEVERGLLQSVSMKSMSSPFTDALPEQHYESVLDLEPEVPVLEGTNVSVEELSNAVYGDEDVDTISNRYGLDPEEISLSLRYYNIVHKDD